MTDTKQGVAHVCCLDCAAQGPEPLLHYEGCAGKRYELGEMLKANLQIKEMIEEIDRAKEKAKRAKGHRLTLTETDGMHMLCVFQELTRFVVEVMVTEAQQEQLKFIGVREDG